MTRWTRSSVNTPRSCWPWLAQAETNG